MSIWWSEPHGAWRYRFQYKSTTYGPHPCLRDDGTAIPKTHRGEAKRFEQDRKVEARKHRQVAMLAPRSSYTLAQAVRARIERYKEDGYKDVRMVESRLRVVLGYFGPDTVLATIGEPEIGRFRTHLVNGEIVQWKGGPRKPADKQERAEGMKPRAKPTKRTKTTVNRILTQLSATLTQAHKDKNPLTRRPFLAELPTIPYFDEPKRVPNPITDEDMLAIIENAPQHLCEFLALVRLMGFREQELLQLERDWIRWQDMVVWLPAHLAKSGDEELLPIPQAAVPLLMRLSDRAREAGQKQIILYADPKKGGRLRPIKSLRTAWLATCRRAGLLGKYRPHGMRSRFITAVAETNSGPITQALARHAHYATTQGYVAIARGPRHAGIDAMNPGAAMSVVNGTTNRLQKSTPKPDDKPEKAA
jgi:integrase